jgi:hypothetical protein
MCNACRTIERRLYKYGVSGEQFDAMLKEQDARCAICRTIDPGNQGWNLDHDHTTGAARGVLCYSCNIGIGHLGDDLRRVLLAALYLAGTS